jgi:hypothetical protein
MKTEAVVAIVAFIVVVIGIFIIFNFNGFTTIDWQSVLNIKTYPKN